MEKRVKHSKQDNYILAYALLFILAGFFFTSAGTFSLTGMFMKNEPCRNYIDPFSGVKICRGISTNQYCVWDTKFNDCKFVKHRNICSKDNPNGFCSKPTDRCTSFGFSNICT